MSQPERNAEPRMPAVLYGAKSTSDPRGSIATQLADCRTSAEREGREVIETFADEAASAYKGSRGDELLRAREHAERLADERGGCELWVQHSDRLARGDGLAAAHLIEYVLWARKAGVQLRSVQDDGTFDDFVHAVLMGERNHDDSRRKSEAVRSGLRRSFERGERGGGPVPDGYELLVRRDGRDRVVERVYRLDPDRAPVVRVAFELSEQGMGDPSIARELNRRGMRTKSRRPWERRRVQDTLTNEFYAGRVVRHRGTPEQEVRDGAHPALIEPGRFDWLVMQRALRDRAAGSARSPKGRPASNHALARLARCGTCWAPMRPVTSTYRRKDGTRARSYLCAEVKAGTGLCSAPGLDAELVDRAVIANLDRYLGDFEAWRADIEAGHVAERKRAEREVDRAGAAVAKVQRTASAIEADYERLLIEGSGEEARAVLPLLSRRRGDVEAAGKRLEAAQAALAAVPSDAPADAMLDFYNALSGAVRGRLDGAESMLRVRDALAELFDAFVLERSPVGVSILPVVSAATATRLMRGVEAWPHAVPDAVSGVMLGPAEEPDELLMLVHVPESERAAFAQALDGGEPVRVEGLAPILATGAERIVPPLRAIEAPEAIASGELAERQA